MNKRFHSYLLIIFISVIILLSGCRDDPPNEVFSPEDARGRFIGAMAGTPSVKLAEDLGAARTFESTTEMMNQLRAGIIDCAIMESTTAAELVSDTPGVRVLYESLVVYDMHFAVPRENNELLAAVDNALAALHQNGTLRGLSNKYFAGRNYTYRPPVAAEPPSRHLSVALPPDSPPFSYKNDSGELVGMDVEVARAVCDQLGVELRLIEYDSAELINAVWFGRADLALGWVPGEGEDIINVSEAYANAIHVVIVRR